METMNCSKNLAMQGKGTSDLSAYNTNLLPNDFLSFSETVRWLISTPSSDCNFKSKLEIATLEELQTALQYVKCMPRAKTKITVLERAISKVTPLELTTCSLSPKEAVTSLPIGEDFDSIVEKFGGVFL